MQGLCDPGCGNDCRGNANNTATDVGANFLANNWHHRNGSGGVEPVRFIIAAGKICVAVRESHGGENGEAGASLT